MGHWLNRSAVVALLAVGVWYYTRPDPISQLEIHGTWEPEFKGVADVFRELVQSGKLRGGSFAVYLNGKPAVRVWGGYSDEQFGLEWKENTITHLASTSKFVTALAFNTLIDRGLVNYDDLVSKHWPEFAQNGKDNVTVRVLISHMAGVSSFDEKINFGDVATNPDKIEKIAAKQKPHWPPGTAIGYHALTIGVYVDFLARKIDPKHRPVYQIFEEEFQKPLGLDVFIGTPLAEQYRVARVHQPSILQHAYSLLTMSIHRWSFFNMMIGNPFFNVMIQNLDTKEMETVFASAEVRASPIPAAGGIGSAISLAKLAGFVAARTPVNGRPLLSDRVVTKLNTPSFSGQELAMKFNFRVGHGTFMYTNPWGEDVFGHPGAGGQFVYSDPTNKVGLAFVTNHFAPFVLKDDLRFLPLEKAFYDCLRKTKKNTS